MPQRSSSQAASLTDTALPLWKTGLRRQLLLATLAGALLPLALAPLNLWPLAFVAPLLLALLLRGQRLYPCLTLACGFGIGMFAVGASWVYVSIHQYGNASMPLAGLMTGLFVAFLGLIFGLPFGLLARLRQFSLLPYLIGFSVLWVLGEWLRSWLLTGFPWLYLGYSQLATPLSAWAPVIGVYGVSLLTLACSCCIAITLLGPGRLRRGLAVLAGVGIFSSGLVWQQASWTTPAGAAISVALVQPNIDQAEKWRGEFVDPSLKLLQRLTAEAADADWVVWPEAAVPLLYHRALPFLEQVNDAALHRRQALITGILYDERKPQQALRVYNSLVGFGLATGIYHKTHLVPFGEYVPLEQWLRGLIEFFNLPMSIISSGSGQGGALQVGALRLSAAICYEIAYPDLVARNSVGSAAIITVSNDAWFGHSWGPLQHLQMARMRALESRRYVVRATNNGVSAIIAPDGQVVIQSEQFSSGVTRGDIIPLQGSTPYMQYGSRPLIIVLLLVVLVLTNWHRFRPGRFKR